MVSFPVSIVEQRSLIVRQPLSGHRVCMGFRRCSLCCINPSPYLSWVDVVAFRDPLFPGYVSHMCTQFCILFVLRLYLLQICHHNSHVVLPVCGVVYVFPDDLGINNSAASSIDFVMLASLVQYMTNACCSIPGCWFKGISSSYK